MSTIKVENKLNKIEDYYRSFISVEVSETLADFVRRVRQEKKLSTTQIEELSRRGGRKGVSDAYVSRIENGYVQNVSPAKLAALAVGLGVSEEEIFAVARGKTPNQASVMDEKFELMSLKFGGLPATKKEKASALIEMLDREIERIANEK